MSYVSICTCAPNDLKVTILGTSSTSKPGGRASSESRRCIALGTQLLPQDDAWRRVVKHLPAHETQVRRLVRLGLSLAGATRRMRPVASKSHVSSELRTRIRMTRMRRRSWSARSPWRNRCTSTAAVPVLLQTQRSIGCHSEVLLLGHAQEEGICDSGGGGR